MKNQLVPILTLSTLSVFSNFAECQSSEKVESTLLTIDCSSDKQKSCIDGAIKAFDAAFNACSEGRPKDTIRLETFADKKFTSIPLSDVDKQQRKDWIVNVGKNCSATLNTPYDPKISSSWVNQFMVGYSINSSYNKDKEHEGLGERSPFAQFGFDGRWVSDNYNILHWEIGGLFASSPALIGDDETQPAEDTTTDNTDSSAEIPAETPAEAPTNNTPEKPTFNDVSDSLDIYTKVTVNFWTDDNDKELRDYFTVGGLAGFKTRESITDEQDAVVFYYGILSEYLYFGKNMRNARNSIPRGKVWLGYLNFEEYGGLEDQKRLLIRGEWQLNSDENADPNDGRFVVGVKANLGKGADDVGIFFAYRSGFDSIKSFITGN
ncbi:hypothetical protein FJ444_20230 [Aestuariibacter sp. GS-14]|uniref:hypothetical protein n=1 Tax=Aestuariibacter sp. GS-14 TaxID=2590670 RepID=UPI00112A86FF|nr:hypothetical protein [Aestuariibacter sp. GS-14]TPV53860.1 hypothetical protein FJ444_20230 [Aestuariibacter sp. GS-14]